MTKNSNLHKAKSEKNDEFYTQISDIEKEMQHYTEHFRDAVVFCNCDDPETSNFWKFFELNFDHLGLKKLISTHYDAEQPTYKLEMTRGVDVNGDGKIDHNDAVKTSLTQNGDFRSPECLALLDEADIVVTNPPFSLFREYLSTLMEHKKKFIIIGNQNALTYKEVFALLQSNQLWVGANAGDMSFRVPDWYPPRETRYWVDENGQKWRSLGNVCWFTNLDFAKRHEDLDLYKKYKPEDYPEYDNYKAIEVKKVDEIPEDYDGAMGVPITFMYKYNPEQFEIIWTTDRCGDGKLEDLKKEHERHDAPVVNGKGIYKRIIIKHKHPKKSQ